MPRILIQDVPQNTRISTKEMEQVLGGNGVPLPPIPSFGVSIASQRAGLMMVGGQLQSPISSDDAVPDPGPITQPTQ